MYTMPPITCCTFLLLITLHGIFTFPSSRDEYTIRMPGVRTTQDDEYWCYSQRVDNDTFYITKFEPLYDPELAHHMILFSCEKPGSENHLWRCDEMSTNTSPVCEGTPEIVFAWAMGAPSFKMPEGVSCKVGLGTPKKYLVLQIHYKSSASFESDENKVDTSGIRLTVQTTPTNKLSGVYLLVSGGKVLPKQTTKLEMSCTYTGQATLHPFAYRVHAHSHGVLNEGYVLEDKNKYLIGSKSPQVHQTFYPVENKSLEIHNGDNIAAMCIMKNDEDKVIPMGSTRQDEMCNFYVMYWVDKDNEDQLYDEKNQICYVGDESDIENEMKNMYELSISQFPWTDFDFQAEVDDEPLFEFN
ncbi:unnamed protein product [Trichobilharzia szidati]|nr:unnamed protein product [Trichobilharzia szidati]